MARRHVDPMQTEDLPASVPPAPVLPYPGPTTARGQRDRHPARTEPVFLWRPLALAAACIVLSGGSILSQFSVKGLLSSGDSWAPMRAAIDLLGTASADRLYETLFFERHTKMQYPPTSLLPLQLLDALGLGRLRTLNLLNAGLAAINAGLLALLADRLLTPRLGLAGAKRWAVLALAALSALTCYPILRGLQLGQIQVWLDIAFTAACLLLARGRPIGAGLVMGLAALVKPQFLPLLLLAAVARQWCFGAAFALVAGTAGLVSVWRFGLHDHLEYLEVLRFIGRHGESFYANNSVNGVVNRLLSNGSNLEWSGDAFAPYHPLVFATTGLTALAFMLTPMLLRPPHGDRPAALLHLCLATLCFVMASPVAWEHHYGILPAMFIVAIDRIAASPTRQAQPWVPAALAAAWLLAASNLSAWTNRLSETALNPLQATHFLGAAILAGLMALLLHDAAAPAAA